MKRSIVSILLLILFLLPVTSFGQLKRDLVKPEISEALTKPMNNFLFGLFDPSRMQMYHTVSMSFATGGGNNLFFNTYMNSMNFKLSEKLFLKTNLGIMTSPYHTYGENSMFNDPIFFGGAELNYQLNERTNLLLRFESSPFYYRSQHNRLFYNGFE